MQRVYFFRVDKFICLAKSMKNSSTDKNVQIESVKWYVGETEITEGISNGSLSSADQVYFSNYSSFVPPSNAEYSCKVDFTFGETLTKKFTVYSFGRFFSFQEKVITFFGPNCSTVQTI